jgi:hypothetical protein
MAASAQTKPTVLVTRKLPDDVEERAAKLFEARLNPEDKLYSPEALRAAADGFDGLLITPAEKMTAENLQKLPDSVRIIATFSVGYDHIDVPAAVARGIAVTNTPDVLTAATADIAMLLMLGAARGASWGERMVREDKWRNWSPTYPARQRRQRPAPRHPRHGTHRPGARAPGAGLRHDHPLSRALAPAGRARAGRGLPRQPRRHAAALRLPVGALRLDAGDPRHHQRARHQSDAGQTPSWSTPRAATSSTTRP